MSTYGNRRPTPEQRFWQKVDRSDDCWRYLGAREKTGRGKVSWHGSVTSASLVAWEILRGEKPRYTLKNKCGDAGCCNPDHWRELLPPPPKPSYDEKIRRRIQSRVAIDNGCWVWQGACDPAGYGRISYLGGSRYVHRVAYQLFVGRIADGTELDHLCRNRACCNPKHLEAVTHRVNLERSPLHIMFNPELRPLAGPKPKTHCKNGHELTPANRYHGGRGRCAVCARRYAAETAERKKNDADHQQRVREQRKQRYERNRNDPAFKERERERNREYRARQVQQSEAD